MCGTRVVVMRCERGYVTGPEKGTETVEEVAATCSFGAARPGCTTRPRDQGQFYELLHIVLVVLLCFSRCSVHCASLCGEPQADSAATKVTTIMPRLHSNYDYTNLHTYTYTDKYKHDEKKTAIYRA